MRTIFHAATDHADNKFASALNASKRDLIAKTPTPTSKKISTTDNSTNNALCQNRDHQELILITKSICISAKRVPIKRTKKMQNMMELDIRYPPFQYKSYLTIAILYHKFTKKESFHN